MLFYRHMHLPSSIRRSIGVAAVLCTVPSFVFAASPQQELTTSLMNSLALTPVTIDGTLKLNIVSKPVAKGFFNLTGSAQFSLMERIVSNAANNTQNEGTVSIDAFQTTTQDPNVIPSLTSPITLDWKRVGQTMHIRLHELPIAITDDLGLPAQATDALKMFVNQWISIDLSELPMMNSNSSDSTFSKELLNPSSLDSLVKRIFGKSAPLIFLGVEKNSVSADGAPIMRVRAKINPSFISKMQNDELAAIRKKPALSAMARSFKSDSIKEVNARYIKLRQIVSATRLAINIDTRSHLIQRIEVGGSVTQPHQTCTTTYKKTFVTSCKITSKDTITYTGAINLKKDTAGPVIVPTDARSFMEVIQSIESSLMPADEVATPTSTTP